MTSRTGWRSLPGAFLARTDAQGWADFLFVPLVTIALAIYFASVNEFFLQSSNITNIFVQGSVLWIVAFGVTFVILAGELDLSVGSGVALVSVLSSFVMRDSHSILLGVLVGIAVGISIGATNGLIVTKLGVPSFIATFGMLVIASGIALATTNGGVVAGLPLDLGNFAIKGIFGIKWIILVTALVYAAAFFLQTQTAFGTRVFAIGGNPVAARLTGIKVDRIRLMVFMLSGLTMGLGGLALTARLQSGQPNAGNLLELDAIAAVVIGGTSITGGRGSVTRTLWGVLLIAILRNGLDLQGVGDDKKQIIIGLVLIAAASADFVRRRVGGRRSAQEKLVTATATSAAAPSRSAGG